MWFFGSLFFLCVPSKIVRTTFRRMRYTSIVKFFMMMRSLILDCFPLYNVLRALFRWAVMGGSHSSDREGTPDE